MSNIEHLFPIPIGMFNLDRPLTDEELLFARGQETRSNAGNLTSQNSYVLRDSLMTPLRSWVEDCLSEYFKATVNPSNDIQLRITQSWFNYSETGQWHHKHTHPNSLVSGVFYLNTNSDDKIYFHRSGYQQFKFTPQDWNLYNTESWWFEAVTGRLVLFPSSLEHSVPNVTGEAVRISMSFNSFPVGTIGSDANLDELRL